MRLLAHFDEQEREQRGAARRALRLDLPGHAPSAGEVAVTIRDLSLTGMLIETPAELESGESFRIDLPEGGNVEATVVWTSGLLYGCQFNRPISPAALSAAILKGEARPPEPGAGPEPDEILAEIQRITADVQRITAKVERSLRRLEDDIDGA